MKVTCEFCGGSGELQVGTGTPSSEGGEDWCLIDCYRCSGTGRVESRPRHTSLTLACANGGYDFLRLSEDPGTQTLCVELAASTEHDGMARAFIYLDAESEASLLKWLKAREEERRG